MEQTLMQMLYDLQCFPGSALYFGKLQGNKIGGKRWRIRWIHTVGGEKFVFNQVSDFNLGEGSGIYFNTRKEAATYAEEITKTFLNKNRHPMEEKLIGDKFEYDWFKQLPEYMEI